MGSCIQVQNRICNFYDIISRYDKNNVSAGDLKPAVGKVMGSFMDKIQDRIKKDNDVKKSDAAMKAFIKKTSKAKK